MKKLIEKSAKLMVLGLALAGLSNTASATTCVGSAGAVYFLAEVADSTQTNPTDGYTNALNIGGPKAATMTLSQTNSNGCKWQEGSGGSSADTHFPTTSNNLNQRSMLMVKASGGQPANLMSSILFQGTPENPGTRWGFCEKITTNACDVNGTVWAQKFCCCHGDDCAT